MRERVAKARADGRASTVRPAVVRSLGRLADRLQRETLTDPDVRENVAHLRELARGVAAGDVGARQQAERIEAARQDPDKLKLYDELREQIRQRDQARGRAERRDRGRDEGGRER
jgi:hypothetical protein